MRESTTSSVPFRRAAAAGLPVMLSAAALLAALAAAPAEASFSGKPGNIVFQSARTGSGQIWLRHSDGAETEVTSQAGGCVHPRWSPTGRLVVYNCGPDIWTMTATGGHQVNLTRGLAGNASNPTFSPDGTEIAFASDLNGGGIFLMNQDGTKRHELIGWPSGAFWHDLSWSPDGSRIAFTYSASGHDDEIYTLSAVDGSGLTDLTNDDSVDGNPDWSPSGAQLTFVSNRASGDAMPWVMNSDGSGATALGTPSGYTAAVATVFAPDGSAIVYGANYGLGSQQLWQINPGGSGLTQLTFDPGQPYNQSPSVQPVHHVAITLTPPSDPPGSTVQVAGSGFLLGITDHVKITFKDAAGVRTKLGTAKTNGRGAVSANVTIPAGAAVGKGTVTLVDQGGLSGKATFTVTAG